jgi:hypothetical protein
MIKTLPKPQDMDTSNDYVWHIWKGYEYKRYPLPPIGTKALCGARRTSTSTEFIEMRPEDGRCCVVCVELARALA